MNDQHNAAPDLETVSSLALSGSFDETLNALDAVVGHLERGRLSITDAVTWYEIGLRLSHRCASLLEEASLRVTVLDESYGVAPGSDTWETHDS